MIYNTNIKKEIHEELDNKNFGVINKVKKNLDNTLDRLFIDKTA